LARIARDHLTRFDDTRCCSAASGTGRARDVRDTTDTRSTGDARHTAGGRCTRAAWRTANANRAPDTWRASNGDRPRAARGARSVRNPSGMGCARDGGSTTSAWLSARSVQVSKGFRSRAAAEQNEHARTERDPIHPAQGLRDSTAYASARRAKPPHFFALIRDLKTER
jgi:hypothetical protein